MLVRDIESFFLESFTRSLKNSSTLALFSLPTQDLAGPLRTSPEEEEKTLQNYRIRQTE